MEEKRKTKFKVGDRVVVVHEGYRRFNGWGKVDTITEVELDFPYAFYWLEVFKSAEERWLISEDEYNSPLYEALR